jgi:FkbM family methyltransferase
MFLSSNEVLLLIGGLTFISILLVLNSYQKTVLTFYTFSTSSPLSSPPIIYGNFTCQTWKNASYINERKYRECLSWGQDGSFWAVQGLRHTAHKDRLNSSSLIVEIGGNRGHDIVEFVKLYNTSIISYEPLTENYNNLVEQFKTNSRIEFRQFGVGSRARNISVELRDTGNAGTSIFRKVLSENSSNVQQIQLLDVMKELRNIQRTRTKDNMIDMISINCEGCEFEILPALVLNGMLPYFRNLQFASHGGLVQDTSCIYCLIEQALEQTHRINFHYRLLWEGWILKNQT